MPKRYAFELAGEKDDSELRDLIRHIPMDGRVRIVFAKEPSFFAAERIGSLSSEVIACREQETGRIVGFGTRSIRRVFVNGVPKLVGYLASLRGIPEARGRTLLARGYQALKNRHESNGTVPFYFTTILEDNLNAKIVLTSGRAGFPTYQNVGLFNTHTVSTRLHMRKDKSDLQVSNGSSKTLQEIVSFLNRHNSHYLFAPALEISDFLEGGIYPCFHPEHFFVVRQKGELLGVAGLWDQHALKQVVVSGYQKPLRFLRPLYNQASHFTGLPKLPKAGGEIRLCYSTFIAIRNREPDIFVPLLDAMLGVCREHNIPNLVLGFSENDPLNEVIMRIPRHTTLSRIYMVYWEDGKGEIQKIERSMPLLEVATL